MLPEVSQGQAGCVRLTKNRHRTSQYGMFFWEKWAGQWWPKPSYGVRLFRPAALWLLLPSIHIKHRSRGNFVLNSGNSFKSYSPEYFTWAWLRLALLFLPLNLCSLMPTNSKITQRCLGEGNRGRKSSDESSWLLAPLKVILSMSVKAQWLQIHQLHLTCPFPQRTQPTRQTGTLRGLPRMPAAALRERCQDGKIETREVAGKEIIF